MTIIHLLVGLGGGGAEHFLLELSKNIRKNPKNDVIVVTLTSINTIAYKFDAADVKHLSLNIRGVKSLIPAVRQLLVILKKYNTQVVHAHMFHAVMLACITKLVKPSMRIIFTLHTNYIKQYYRKVLLWITKGLRSTDTIFSSDSKQWYHKSDAVIIHNGIDIAKFNYKSSPPSIFTLLFLGRLSEPKNPLYLVELAKHLRKNKLKFQIWIAGDGEYRQTLEQRVREYKMEDEIIFLGFQNHIPQLLVKVHALIMPSLWEGMPMAILEAGAAGLPVISTPVGSIPSILNQNNAYLSTIEHFHLYVKDVMLNYGCAVKKALQLQKQIKESFDISISAKKYLDLYNSVLSK